MGYFLPQTYPQMYDSQINMISKPFELNKERLRKKFMSQKYENRRKEFFAIYYELLQTHIRKEYYNFMNDIQIEVNFFEWFDRNYKTKTNAKDLRTTKNWLQEENNKIAHEEISPHKSIVTSHRNQQLIADNIYLDKKQTPLANKHGQIKRIYTINKINQDNANIKQCIETYEKYKDMKNHKHKPYKSHTREGVDK
jgi:hypothetical protein